MTLKTKRYTQPAFKKAGCFFIPTSPKPLLKEGLREPEKKKNS
jgi:hypothetical protein